MSKNSGVVRPSIGWFLLLDGGIVVLARLALSQATYDKAAAMSSGKLPPRPALRRLLAATAAIHVGESMVAGRMARRRGLAQGGWRLQTFVVGFPSLLALRRKPIS